MSNTNTSRTTQHDEQTVHVPADSRGATWAIDKARAVHAAHAARLDKAEEQREQRRAAREERRQKRAASAA